MHYHLILTEKCNSKCKYCYEKSMNEFDNGLEEKWEFDISSPADSEVDIKKLKEFFAKDKNPTIYFYGGEPLMKLDKMKEVMDNIPARFGIQTNGKLLPSIPDEYLTKISRMLVSIDGDEERTDYNRGKRNYFLVLKGIENIRKRGFKGEIVARMTISFPDIYEQVLHLIELIKNGLFDSIHWQLDVAFYKNDFNEDNFKKFVEEYNKNISKLINWWMEEMKKGKVWKIFPFIGLVDSLLKKEKVRLRCGSGYENYTITTNGKIVPCPIMNSVKTFYCGDLDSNPNSLQEFQLKEPCSSCYYLETCGGRCLYTNRAKLWPPEGEKLICDTIKHLIDSLKEVMPEVEKLIEKNIIPKEDFEYEKYFGPEIIP